MLVLSFIFFQSYFNLVVSIWPPPYKINLTHEEEFVLGEYVQNEENELYNLEDEMIHPEEMKEFHLEKEKFKFVRLHKQAKRYNDKQKDNYLHKNYTLESNETYYNDPIPWEAGFVDNKNNFLKNQENKNVYHYNTAVKQLVAKEIKEKRDDEKRENENRDNEKRENEDNDKDYNYNALDKEYREEVLKEQNMKDTFNASNIHDDEESMKDAIDKMVDFKTMPRNCTEEELKGIGFGAAKCLWLDVNRTKDPQSTKKLLKRIGRIVKIWFIIYLVIAVPCWCQRGWCCCCFQCKFCKPRETINEAKKFLMDFPPGTYHTADKIPKVVKYKPTDYEEDVYKKLKDTLMRIT